MWCSTFRNCYLIQKW